MNTVPFQASKTVTHPDKLFTIEYLCGPDGQGPQQCIHCHGQFREGQFWRRVTSPPDLEYGTYSIGVHEACAQHWPMR